MHVCIYVCVYIYICFLEFIFYFSMFSWPLILGSLSGRLCIFISLRSFFWVFCLVLFGTYFSSSLSFLILCVCLYVLDETSETTTSPSLKGVGLCRKRPMGPRSIIPLATRTRCFRGVSCVLPSYDRAAVGGGQDVRTGTGSVDGECRNDASTALAR